MAAAGEFLSNLAILVHSYLSLGSIRVGGAGGLFGITMNEYFLCMFVLTLIVTSIAKILE